MAPMILDVSSYQEEIDFAQLKAKGVQAVVAKATEGVTYYDKTFLPNHKGAKAAGVPFGAYHFFRPADTALAQASSFLKAIDGYEGQVLPMVDVEVTDGVGYDLFISRLTSFVQLVDKTLGGKRCLIYGSLSFWSTSGPLQGFDGFAGHPFWVAAYNNDSTIDVSSTGWSDWTLWQFTDNAVGPIIYIPGIEGRQPDVSRLSPSLSLEAILR